MRELFSSNVFCMNLNFDEWPSTHTLDEESYRPFNKTIFQIRKHYRLIFHEDRFEPMINDDDPNNSKRNVKQKLYEIQYQLNLLPMIGFHFENTRDPWTNKRTREYVNDEEKFMALCAQSQEITMFQSKNLQNLIKFKWDTYAFKMHAFGTCVHIFYILVLFMYICAEYIYNAIPEEDLQLTSFLIYLCCFYPTIYEIL